MNRIAVLLTVHNRKDKTLECLAGIFRQELPEEVGLEVFLTSDGCTDGTPEAIREQYPQVHLIYGDGSLFWNRGMHAAWSEAEKGDYDYYLWLNDDTILSDGALVKLLDAAAEKQHRAIIVGYTTDESGKYITYGGRSKTTGLMTRINGLTLCDTFNGNIVLIPRSVYRVVGKNDPVFHHAIGDTDYGLRAQKAGFESFVVGTACGVCNCHVRLPKWCDAKVSFVQRCKSFYRPGGNGANPFEFFIYRKRHYGLGAAILTFVSNHVRLLFPRFREKSPSKY